VPGRAPLQEAEVHLQEALARDRKIGMVDHEAAILLELARLRFAQAVASSQSSVDSKKRNDLMQESFNFAKEALEIAERCEYRLQEAEVHNFLAEWHVQQGSKGAEAQGRKESLKKAREHAERAKERAWCDGPPYHYKVAYERAEHLLKSLEESQ